MPPAPAPPPPVVCHTPAAGLFADWRAGIESDAKPALYPVGTGDLRRVEVGPGRVVLIGGQPGAGKTALVMQMVFDALLLTPTLKAAVMNVEMPPQALLTRQLARLARVDASLIRKGCVPAADKPRLTAAFAKLEPLAARLTFVGAPFTLDNAGRSAADFGAGLLVLDYVQRITPPGKHADKRSETNAAMELIRGMANLGVAVVAVAAVNRPTYAGRSKGAVTLGSFRESSELEYGADDAFILTAPAKPTDPAELKHLKSRNGECRDIPLMFNKPYQDFKTSSL